MVEIQVVKPLTTRWDPMENSNCGRTADFYSFGLILYSSIKITPVRRAIGLKCKATGGPAPHLPSRVLTPLVPVNEERVVPLQRVGGADVCQPAGAVPYFVADPLDQVGLRACNYMVIRGRSARKR